MNIRIKYFRHALMVIGSVLAVSVSAQGLKEMLGSGGESTEKILGGESLEKQMQQMQVPKETASLFSDGPVDPKMYRLGPYDVLSLTIWQPINAVSMLTVSPEGKLVVPRVGEFSTSGKTLDSVRTEVIGALQKRMKGGLEASLSLFKPRNILVQVLGEVKQPGSYILTGTSRAGMAIQLANAPTKDEVGVQGQMEAEKKLEARDRDQERKQYFGSLSSATFSVRHISLHHYDGTTENVDLQKFDATHDDRVNPMLREGDIIYLSPKRTGKGQISIYGSVRQSGVFEFVDGDSLSTLVAMAYGPTEEADLTQVTIQHSDNAGHPTTSQVVNIGDILGKRAPDLLLQPGDGVIVKGSVSPRSEFGAVAISGEAMHPSVFGITRGKTTLSEIVKAAGGFTPNANIAAGYVVRQIKSANGQLVNLRESAMRTYMSSPLTLEDTLNFNLQSRFMSGNVVVDFRRLFIDGDLSADVTLEDGDAITIPRNTNQVYVYGQVHQPGFVTYVAGKSAKYYIDRAGGVSESAASGNTGVIKSAGHQWLEADKATVDPGDAVYVPKTPDISAGVREQSVGNIFTAAAVVVTLAGVVVNYILFHK